MSKPLFLKDVTLVGVEGVDVERLLLAAKVCMHYCVFEDVRLFGAGASDSPYVTHIDYMTIEGYARFVLQELHRHIETSHILLIQHDGFVLNPAAWTDEFLDYDYIGAPLWFSDGANVGNGGFSLRSKRLLECTSKLIKGPVWNPEDLLIFRDYRRQLEGMGMRFAPEELASKFCIDGSGNKGTVWEGQFGFHNFRMTDLSRWSPPASLDVDGRVVLKLLWEFMQTSTRYITRTRVGIRGLREEQRRLTGSVSAVQALLRGIVLEEASKAAGFDGGTKDMTLREREDLAVEVFSNPNLRRALGIRYSQAKSSGKMAAVDCTARRSICHGACCALRVPLSELESQNSVYRFNIQRPFELLRRRSGVCTHWRPEGCSIYDRRPGVCSTYSCARDKRIWADFDRMIPGPAAIKWVRECAGKTPTEASDYPECPDSADS